LPAVWVVEHALAPLRSLLELQKKWAHLLLALLPSHSFSKASSACVLPNKVLKNSEKSVDAIIIIPNDRILNTVAKETTAKQAFMMCDEILKQAVEGISDLITTPGVINVDFADIRAILDNAGSALMGIGSAAAKSAPKKQPKAAINSPLSIFRFMAQRRTLLNCRW
jgi:cell division GTPase FtsZ